MNNLKEYIVTLHRHEDLEEFYGDMEILRPTKHNCMPERTVDLVLRRPNSRNTHYWMTEEEADVLREDPRVRAVMLKPAELGITVRPAWTQTSSNWNKSSTLNNAHLNWGLLRTVEGEQRAGWGSNGTPNQTATISISEEGRNVDVIVVDGHFNPDHPEFAVNADGTGGSRVIQLDWHTLTSTVSDLDNDAAFLLTGTYVYTPYTGGSDEGDNNHGAHVAGTIAGSTQGWARRANIYNISPYGTNPNGLDELVLMDYIRAFHNTKTVNPATGRKNPTICNHSWGYGYQFNLSTFPVLSLNFRGITINGPFTESQLRSYGLYATGGFLYAPAEYPALDADVEDAIADGIIMVAAASNDYTKIDVVGGQDYNNRFTISLGFAFYNRGSSPGRANGVICVGSIDRLSTEYKANYSNSGPRIDIWAPGTSIISGVNSGGTTDIRNASYRVAKFSGTSMASPQVCGVLTCVLETYPNLTPAQALDYVKQYAKSGQLTDTGGALDDYQALQGAPNLYLSYKKERPTEGGVFPKLNYRVRPSSGAVYPRVRRI
jgi:subtilisin family serine protease